MIPAVIVVTGNGEPKLYTNARGPAYEEAHDLLKRGVLGHFQFIPAEPDALTTAAALVAE